MCVLFICLIKERINSCKEGREHLASPESVA